MKSKPISNCDLAQAQAQKLFLGYDIGQMVIKFGLKQDAEFTYIPFLGAQYRISKSTGCVERMQDKKYLLAGYNESMTVYDVLCYAKPDAAAAGEYCSAMQLDGVAKSANPGGDMFQKYAKHFAGRTENLNRACRLLGGTPYPVGEVAYQIPLFDFLSVVLQFWDGDDEFDPQLIIKLDKNILSFMHFETTFYATGHLLRRLVDIGASLENETTGDLV